MKRWIVVLLLALVVSLAHMQIFFSSLGERVEPLALDLWFNLRGQVDPPGEVAVVAMDESSYQVLGLPMDQAWPRATHAELVRKLADAGAKRVVMDILFLGDSSDKRADQALAQSMKTVPTVIGADSGVREQGSAAGRYSMEELLLPPDLFSDAAADIALVRMPEDNGFVRRFSVPRSQVTKDVPSLSEAAAGLKHSSPGLPGERDFLWYYGPPGAIPTYPYHQVLNPKGALPKQLFKDKIVFVGLSLRTELGPAQKDTYRTPFYQRSSMFGVEIEATAAANLLEHRWVRRAGAWSEGLALFLTTLLLTFVIFSLRPQWAGVLLVSFVTAWAVSSYLAFLSGLFLPGVVLTAFILPVSYLGSTLVYYLVTHRSQQQVERAFQYYLSPEMAREMRKNPKGLGLGGENVFATALFTDISGFTEVTETMLAAEVSTMLNAYFTEVMEVVFENKGTLIKFIGDAVFVLWGAPIKIPDHGRLACRTALQIQEEVRKFNASKRFPPLNTRIGIHTGPMVVGNLGSARRFDYTAIGDSVNLASRVEGLNKYFGTQILITDSVKKEIAGSGISPFALGTIRVVGKKEGIGLHTIFEIMISKEIETDWGKALNDFRGRKWKEAGKRFEKVKEGEARLATACDLYLEQIAAFTDSPPPDEWNGEVVFSHK
jgi:adenylate cyclase